jgi:hypothetical protein
MGQVGQESNLQPAVVEKAASHSSPSDPVSLVRRDQNLSPFSSQAVSRRLSLLLSNVLSPNHIVEDATGLRPFRSDMALRAMVPDQTWGANLRANGLHAVTCDPRVMVDDGFEASLLDVVAW